MEHLVVAVVIVTENLLFLKQYLEFSSVFIMKVQTTS